MEQTLVAAAGCSAAVLAARYVERTLDSHQGILQTKRLKLIGAGGTHFVFADREQPQDHVIKIARLQDCTENDRRQGVDEAGDATPSSEPLDGYFPAEWLAKSYAVSIPVVMPNGDFRPAANVLVQHYEPNFINDSRIGLQCGYPELIPASRENARRYRSINTLLTGPWSSLAIRDFVAGCPNLVQVTNLTMKDTGFREALAAVVTGTETFVGKTGEIIDLVGNDNVFFYETDSRWACRIGEVAKQDRFDRLKELIGGRELSDNLTNRELGEVLNGFAFVRLLNFLSLIVTGNRSIDLDLGDSGLEILSRRFDSEFWLGRLSDHMETLSLDQY